MKLSKTIGVLAAAMVLSVSATHAQTPAPDQRVGGPTAPLPPVDSNSSGGYGKKPVPAARGVSGPDLSAPVDTAPVEPDTNTLSGAEMLGVGGARAHNTFDPVLTFTELGQKGTSGFVGDPNPRSQTLIGGGVNFIRTWSRYRFSATYNGGETFYQGARQNESFHDLNFAQDVNWERWRLHIRDSFIASPEATFGGSGIGGPGLLGQFASGNNTLGSISQTFVPSQTIQTGQATRYQNTTLGEIEYSFSRRSAVTFSGSYGILHFTQAGYFSSHNYTVQGGYDYLLDPKNSIAVLASYGNIVYVGTNSSTADYLASLAYGRKITGRLAFQISGGPEQIRVTNLGSANYNQLTWTLTTGLTYERRRSGVSLTYARGLTGGSGVFLGAISNTFASSAHYQFSRNWTGTANAGYSFNRSLASNGAATASFNTWFLGGNIARQLGRHGQVGFNYGVQDQSSPTVCPVVSCGFTGLQQTFGMTVNWHLRRIE